MKFISRITRIHHRCRVPVRGPRPNMSFRYARWSFISGFAGTMAIIKATTIVGHPLLIGSFGAPAVLLFGVTILLVMAIFITMN